MWVSFLIFLLNSVCSRNCLFNSEDSQSLTICQFFTFYDATAFLAKFNVLYFMDCQGVN